MEINLNINIRFDEGQVNAIAYALAAALKTNPPQTQSIDPKPEKQAPEPCCFARNGFTPGYPIA